MSRKKHTHDQSQSQGNDPLNEFSPVDEIVVIEEPEDEIVVIDVIEGPIQSPAYDAAPFPMTGLNNPVPVEEEKPRRQSRRQSPPAQSSPAYADMPKLLSAPAMGRPVYHAVKTGVMVYHLIRDNPVPTGLAALGLTWLSRRDKSSDSKNSTGGTSMGSNGTSGKGAVSGAISATTGAIASAASKVGQASAQQGKKAGNAVAGVVKKSPFETAFAVLSLLLFFQSVRQSRSVLGSATEKAGDLAQRAGDKAGTVSSQVQDKASGLAHQVSDKAGAVGSQVQDKASQLGGQAQDQAQKAAGWLGDFMQDYPLVMGAVALVAGAIVGLTLPGTSKENEIMGETRDKLASQAQDAAMDVVHKVQAVAATAQTAATTAAHDAFDQVKDAAQTAAHTAMDSVKDAATGALDQVKEEAKNQGLPVDAVSGE